MKIFVSWSGDVSNAAALALRDAFGRIFKGVDPWVSSEDIDKGSEWFAEVLGVLEDSRFAILCLTPQNLEAPWLLFEAGAIAGKLGTHATLTPAPTSLTNVAQRKPIPVKLAPLMIGCDSDDLPDPLKKFQGTLFDRDEVRKLFATVNDSLDDKRIDSGLFEAAFDGIWPQLDSAVRAALAKYTNATKPKYDVFLSVPMAALNTEKKYVDFRREAMKVFRALHHDCGLTVRWAMENIPSKSAFDTRDESATDDLRAIQQSASFLMLFPERLLTGAIFEAGFALALGKPTRIFVKEESHLPFMMQELPQIYSNVAIYDKSDWTTYAQIAEMVVRYKDNWFKPGTRARMKVED